LRIAVCSPQVPFSRGGAEVLAEELVGELRSRGHQTDLVTVPFRWFPGTRVLTNALLWRLIELDTEANPVDLVIATKFPSYAIRHPRKVVWLVHQFRQAYDLDGTELGQFGEQPVERATRRAVHRLDRLVLGEARALFAISSNVARRLQESLGLSAEVLYPPPQRLNFRCDEYGDFLLSVGRLDRAKRVDLLVQAAAAGDLPPVRVAGDGPDRPRLEALASQLGVDGRIRFLGGVPPDELVDLYARCLAVFYGPIDEDFGYVPYEAFLSEKPVITTRDAGGVLEAVREGKTGVICEPTPAAVAEACRWVVAHPEEAQAMGREGYDLARRLTWDLVIDRLLA
jgi:glycosyltransferase involved in cell wall biosynthesis